MEQVSIKIKALNPVIKTKTSLIIEEISKFAGISLIELNDEDPYSFVFTFTAEADSDITDLTDKIRALLRFHGSTILSLSKG
ncbi:MAG: hypothetical protein LBS20_06175 [Prevotella sp.]|uniref:hypothetical protein n=1 Tax=unclassified Dysgonomonas TaxID=2630389 RepID=UPI0025BEBFB7|nr:MULTISPECIES: hypothetical protein [unclassified Dysgonomonas]MDR1715412.1 hypothetical protein [Prevotella sp.]MDR2002708.1 hypothetical protein [Prevotella sp.]HMM03599.1 hypothetical protein [Dysgonomonas sp.]